MRGMILAAGLGTRLAPLTDKTPKPLIEVGGEPLIVRQILQLKEGGVSDIIINLHHLGEMIFNRVGNCLLYTSPSPRDRTRSRMPSSA